MMLKQFDFQIGHHQTRLTEELLNYRRLLLHQMQLFQQIRYYHLLILENYYKLHRRHLDLPQPNKLCLELLAH
jgi:hypothetical protein